MANKYKAFGVALKRKNGASYDTIPQLVTVRPPDEQLETLDTTTHDSEGGYREIVASFKSGGNCTASFLFDPGDAVQAALHTDYVAATKNSYKVTTTAGSPAYSFAFDAFITAWSPSELSIDGKMECSITLTVTGPVTISNS